MNSRRRRGRKTAGALLLGAAVLLSSPPGAASADDFEQVYAASSEAAAKRDWPAAAELAERAYLLGREKFGSPHATTATLALNSGVALAKTPRRDEARQRLEDAIAASRGVDLDEPTDAMAWLEIARLERNGQRPDRYADRAIKILETRYDKATRSYQRALSVYEAQDPKDELRILALHEHLAVTYEKLGKDDLVDYHMEACAIEQLGDSEPIAVIRYEPRYPPRALRSRKEGWVQIQFTIAANGRVVEPRVVDSKPKGMFDESVLAAIKTWRYKPKIEAGQVVPREDAVVRFDFSLN